MSYWLCRSYRKIPKTPVFFHSKFCLDYHGLPKPHISTCFFRFCSRFINFLKFNHSFPKPKGFSFQQNQIWGKENITCTCLKLQEFPLCHVETSPRLMNLSDRSCLAKRTLFVCLFGTTTLLMARGAWGIWIKRAFKGVKPTGFWFHLI